MSSIQTIQVHTTPAYQVSIGPGLLAGCGRQLLPVLGPCHVAVITDSTVAPLYLDTVAASLRDAGFTVSTVVFPAGEGSKNFTTLSTILEALAEARLTRADCVAALGGGGAFAYIKFIKPKQGAKVSTDPDDYEFEDEEYENEDVPEQEEQEDQN